MPKGFKMLGQTSKLKKLIANNPDGELEKKAAECLNSIQGLIDDSPRNVIKRQSEKINNLEKENKQLKSYCKSLENMLDRYSDDPGIMSVLNNSPL